MHMHAWSKPQKPHYLLPRNSRMHRFRQTRSHTHYTQKPWAIVNVQVMLDWKHMHTHAHNRWIGNTHSHTHTGSYFAVLHCTGRPVWTHTHTHTHALNAFLLVLKLHTGGCFWHSSRHMWYMSHPNNDPTLLHSEKENAWAFSSIHAMQTMVEQLKDDDFDNMYIYTHTHTCIHTYIGLSWSSSSKMTTLTTCVSLHTHTCIHTYIHT
jgi:hypothetical protein